MNALARFLGTMKANLNTLIGMTFTLVYLTMASANASIITVDFDDQTGGLLTEAYQENGFTFSPNCHYDFTAPGPSGYAGSEYIGIDTSACGGDGIYNSSFAGPSEYQVMPDTPFHSIPPVLYIEHGGNPFSLIDFWSPHTYSWTLESSKGGFLQLFETGSDTVVLSDPDWGNVDWLLFKVINDPGKPYFGLDHMRFQVPEPSILALMGLGLAGLGFSRKRKAA